jgi:hypothetical protein
VNKVRIELVRSARDRRVFIGLARQLNVDRQLWVPSLARDQRHEIDPRHNPFYQNAVAELFVAYRENKPVGRIAAIENRAHNAHRRDRIGFFGHYECIDDTDVSQPLFAAAEKWLAERGLNCMRGPTNPSMNANIGFLIDGFQYTPTIPMPYTHRYYPAQAEASGLQKAMDVIVYGWDYDDYSDQHTETVRNRIRRLSRQVQKRNRIRVRGPNLDRVDDELEIIRRICNDSLADNWGFVPMTDEEVRAAGNELKQVIDPEMFSIAEIDGHAQAVFLACPDYNELLARMNGRILPWGWLTYLRYRRRIRKYVVYVYAATRKADALGAGVLLYERFFDACFRKGIKYCETGYVLETNMRMRNTIEKLGAKQPKRYRMFEKPIR